MIKKISKITCLLGGIYLVIYIFFEEYLPSFFKDDLVQMIILWSFFLLIILFEILKRKK